MAGKINILGHPVHPMVIVYPLTFFTAAVVLDVIYLLHHGALVGTISFWSIGLGIVSGLVAAIFGTADWIGLESGTRAKRIGLWHGGVNVLMTALFAVSWLLRRQCRRSLRLSLVLLLSPSRCSEHGWVASLFIGLVWG